MAETVAALRQEGFVAAKSDPTDGRKTLMSITPAERKLISTIRPTRDAWLEAAIEKHLTSAERRGSLPNLRFPIAAARNRLQTGGWAREAMTP